MKGELGILNVGAGDTKLTFDPKNPVERERAAKIVLDMIHRGYSILVQIGETVVDGKKEPIFRRAHGFDPNTCEYIVAGAPDEVIDIGKTASAEPEHHKGKGGKQRVARVRIPAERTRAVSVGRTAGG